VRPLRVESRSLYTPYRADPPNGTIDNKSHFTKGKTPLSLRLFEEPVETPEAQQLDAPILSRIISCGLASLVAVVPALAAALTAWRVTNFYASMTNPEHTARPVVTATLHHLNTPLVVALGVSALLAFVIALVLAVDPKSRMAGVGLPFSIGIPLIPAVPALLLWTVETTTLDILTGRITGGSVDEMAQKISLLLLGAMIFGVVAVGITGVCAVISLVLPVRRRTDALSLRRPFVWAVTGVLMLVFAGAYFVVV
jgi:hypothetical protein